MSGFRVGDRVIVVDVSNFAPHRHLIGLVTTVEAVNEAACPHGFLSHASHPYRIDARGQICNGPCSCLCAAPKHLRLVPRDEALVRQETVRWDQCPWAPGRGYKECPPTEAGVVTMVWDWEQVQRESMEVLRREIFKRSP